MNGSHGDYKVSIDKDYLDSECIRIRQLVEQVHDKAFIVDNSNCIERTEDGEILFKIMFGLDSLRQVIKQLDISTNK